MNNYDNTIICDYVTLWIKDANNNPNSDFNKGKAVWDISPQAYYYKDRGSVCLMSIVDGTFEPGSYSVTVMTQQGFNSTTAQIHGDNNQFEDDIQDLGTLGCFCMLRGTGGNFETIYQAPELIRVLTPAKPRSITLYFIDDDKKLNEISGDIGHITLKFEYVKPEILQNNIYSTDPKIAF